MNFVITVGNERNKTATEAEKLYMLDQQDTLIAELKKENQWLFSRLQLLRNRKRINSSKN